LAGIDLLPLTPEQQPALVKRTTELVAAEMVDADRPEAHLNLALLDLRRRRLTEAEAEYRTASRLTRILSPPSSTWLISTGRAAGMMRGRNC
jgi:hypothetical protein